MRSILVGTIPAASTALEPESKKQQPHPELLCDNNGYLLVAFSGSNGSSSMLDSSGSVKTVETTMPVAEDDINGVIAGIMKPVASPLYAPIVSGTLNTVCSGALKAAPGNILSVWACNDTVMASGERLFLQLHNLTSTPGQGAVPVEYFSIPAPIANTPGQLFVGMDYFTQPGTYYTTGISWSVSAASGTNVAPADPKLKGISTRFRWI